MSSGINSSAFTYLMFWGKSTQHREVNHLLLLGSAMRRAPLLVLAGRGSKL